MKPIFNAIAVAVLVVSAPVVQAQVSQQQRSIVSESIKADAQDCAQGTKDGSIGKAIKDAMDIHINLAGSQIDTEKFFAPDSNCFSNLLKINDLSFAIPSLGSIVSAAQKAVSKFIQKEVCSVAGDLASTVLDPLNSTIDSLNGIASFRTINGFTGDMGDLSFRTNPNSRTGSYSVNANPFDMVQSAVGSGGSSSSMTVPPSSAPATVVEQPAKRAAESPQTTRQPPSAVEQEAPSTRAGRLGSILD